MTVLRISSATSMALDSLKGRMNRVASDLSPTTTLKVLARAEQQLAEITAEARSLRMMVRGEKAAAERAERDREQQRQRDRERMSVRAS